MPAMTPLRHVVDGAGAAAPRFVRDLDTLVRARYPLIYLVTWEEARLDAILSQLAKTHGIPPERVHVHEGDTRQLLLALTEQLRADIVVMGAIARTGLRRIFIGSTAERVLDRLSCDLWIVKP